MKVRVDLAGQHKAQKEVPVNTVKNNQVPYNQINRHPTKTLYY
jgi:hypothetical protein